MSAASQVEIEQAAYQALLDSGYFQRAPSLRRILVYICTQYFEGKAGQIKEYNIAVEALGKPPNFDQKESSVVRVEVHRLRRRLQQYYAAAGAGAPVEISIPEGSYVPVFVPRHALAAPAGAIEVAAPAPFPVGDWRRKRRTRVARWVVRAAIVIALAGAGIWVAARNQEKAAAVRRGMPVESAPPVATGAEGTIRILAGRPKGTYTDRFGRVWSGDAYFTGGSAVTTPYAPIVRATDQLLYKTMREGGDVRYDIPLAPGSYEMRLYFAETVFGPGNPGSGGETYRIFQIRANGKPLLRDFDVIADAAGANIEDVRVFKDIGPETDGVLHLQLASSGNRSAFLNAIEIKPGRSGMIQPLRFVASDDIYHDPNGTVWYPDTVASGGIFAARPWAERGDPVNGIHRSERFGNFTYTIPVAAGRYRLVLHFAEAWFGPDLPGGGGAGRRIFEIYCNGQTLLKGFDLYKQAGGSKRPLTREFRGITPNAQGKIVLSFVPVVNYAAINALEVLPEPE